MSEIKRTRTVIKRGILGIQSGTSGNITISKNNVIFVSKESVRKSGRNK